MKESSLTLLSKCVSGMIDFIFSKLRLVSLSKYFFIENPEQSVRGRIFLVLQKLTA